MVMYYVHCFYFFKKVKSFTGLNHVTEAATFLKKLAAI